jgi:hypothetical protein
MTRKLNTTTTEQATRVKGRHVSEIESMLDHWPVIDETGQIISIVAGDDVDDDAILVDWVGGRNGHYRRTTADNGFGAILQANQALR